MKRNKEHGPGTAKISISLPKPILLSVDLAAKGERRTRSNMIQILCQHALEQIAQRPLSIRPRQAQPEADGPTKSLSA
jgi:hypothetical protein